MCYKCGMNYIKVYKTTGHYGRVTCLINIQFKHIDYGCYI